MEDLSLHVLDLAQNSISAGATLVEITLWHDRKENHLRLTIGDNGKGMDEKQVIQVSNPFYTTRTTRKVGLGIPMLQASAEATGGSVQIASRPGAGTQISADFHTNHIDCLPLGKMEDTMVTLIFLNPEKEFVYRHESDNRKFLLDTRQIREVLGEADIADPTIMDWIKNYIRDGLEEFNGGV